MKTFILNNIKFTKLCKQTQFTEHYPIETKITSVFVSIGDLFCVLCRKEDAIICKINKIKFFTYMYDEIFDGKAIQFELFSINEQHSFCIENNDNWNKIQFITDRLASAENFLLLK